MARVEKSSDFRRLMDTAKEQGWSTKTTNSGHWAFLPPNNGPMVVTSGTPGDFRAFRNLVSQLRQKGLKISHKGR